MLYRLLALWHRLTAVFRRRRIERDLDEELAFHVAMREADLAANGLPPGDARSAALRRFGNRARVKEELRNMWTFPSIESIWQDTRYALRTLGRARTFAAVAIGTLALGIGGTTAIFSLTRAADAGALPFREPDSLVQLWGTVQREQVERRGASYLDFQDWRAATSAFDDIALFDGGSLTLLEGDAERLTIEAATPAYFGLLGIGPALGRAFDDGEDVGPGGPGLVILSDGLWRQRFGADSQVLGRSILLNGQPFTVIGVMPAGFRGLTDQAQLWVPFTRIQNPGTLASRGSRGFVALARLAPGVSIDRAQAELDTLSRRLEQTYPDTNEKRAVEVSPLERELFGDLRPAIRALMVAVVLVLLMACASVGNLLLARAETRQREIALRTAIGASRGRLLRQLLTESCVLTGLGALAGLGLAHAAIRVLLATMPVTLPSFATPRLDGVAAAFALLVGAGSGLLLGLAPVLHARIARLAEALRDSVRSSGSRRSARIRSGLVVAEISLAVVLLAGAGLMIRSVHNLTTIDPGFDADGVLTVRLSIPREVTPDGGNALPADNAPLLERVRALPGVTAASFASDLPLEGSSSAVFYAAEGQGAVTAQDRPRAYIHRVTPDFFATLRIPLIAGRTFHESDAIPDTPVVIVSASLAQRFWPGQDALGRRIRLGALDSDSPWRRIIGVVGEVNYRGLPQNPTADPDIYFPVLRGQRDLALVARTSGDPAATASALRVAVREMNPRIPVYNVLSLADLVAAQTSRPRFLMWLMGIFAGLALLLATIGVYGVTSYTVAQRTREIGIRLALGATGAAVLRALVRSGAMLIGAGLLLGVAGAAALRNLLASQLFGVDLVDPSAAAAVALLGIVAVLACALPALRASRIDPIEALRQD